MNEREKLNYSKYLILMNSRKNYSSIVFVFPFLGEEGLLVFDYTCTKAENIFKRIIHGMHSIFINMKNHFQTRNNNISV